MRLVSWLHGLPIRWESRGTPLALGRCFIAGAVLLSIVFTPDGALLGTSSGLPASGNCDGPGSISLWCHSDALPGGSLTARVLSICVLAVAMSGYRPRWICIPHWYVTFSISSSIFATLGVDSAAKAMTLLLIPICLGDPRVWQWQRPAGLVSPGWRGTAFASHIVIRLQVFIIYATAVVSKLTDTSWQHGVAIYFVANDPTYGFPASLRALLGPFLGSYWLVAALSWSVIVIQGVIALTVIGTRRMRLIALCCSIALHLAIGVLMSLPTFSLAMIGLVLAAYGGRPVDDHGDQRSDVGGQTQRSEPAGGESRTSGRVNWMITVWYPAASATVWRAYCLGQRRVRGPSRMSLVRSQLRPQMIS